MGKIVDFNEYKTKHFEQNNLKDYIENEQPKIYVIKASKSKYNIIVSESGEKTLFNQIPIPSLAVAIYAASYCKDKLSEYLDEHLSTDIIVFDEACSKELNQE